MFLPPNPMRTLLALCLRPLQVLTSGSSMTVYKEMIPSGEQLDFTKHSASLLEASQAGKWHLLEHAFDTILEAGEIPPVSFFSEMVCQATARCDYERAVGIINSIAHSPFQVGFEHWFNLFEKNVHMIDHANLNELQETLVSRDLVQEATVLNLSRALQYICRSHDDGSMIGKVTSDSCDGESDGSESTILLYFCNNFGGPDLVANDYTRQGDSKNRMRFAKTSFSREEQETEERAGVRELTKQFLDDDPKCDMSESDYDYQESERVENGELLSDYDYQESEHVGNEEILSNVGDFNFELVIP